LENARDINAGDKRLDIGGKGEKSGKVKIGFGEPNSDPNNAQLKALGEGGSEIAKNRKEGKGPRR